MIGLLRVKNEARWIERSLASIAPICRRTIVLDDHSTDDTAGLAAGCGAEVIGSPFAELNESRDKDFLLQRAYAIAEPNEWALMIDGDEALVRGDADVLAEETATGALALSLRVLYLWGSEDQVRVDGVYGRFNRASAFRLIPGLEFGATGRGPNFHCGNVPWFYHQRARRSAARLLHYGYMFCGDRLRKYDWYNELDPGNANEDFYKHMVVGDIFPADSVFRHGGPLQLEALNG